MFGICGEKIKKLVSLQCVFNQGRAGNPGRQDEPRVARVGNTALKVFPESRVMKYESRTFWPFLSRRCERAVKPKTAAPTAVLADKLLLVCARLCGMARQSFRYTEAG